MTDKTKLSLRLAKYPVMKTYPYSYLSTMPSTYIGQWRYSSTQS